MTVCVAAISDGRSFVMGASDRMLTAEDIEFEPAQIKFVRLTNSIVAMLAGDSSFNSELLIATQEKVNVRLDKNPTKWLNVRDVADIYSKCYQQATLKRAERVLLAPLNLDRASFLAKQKSMDPGLVVQIAADMLNFSPTKEGVEVIFAGIDDSLAHIYVVRGSEVSCYDSIGFAAIGTGAWHAKSQFMFSGHSGYKLLPETLLLTYRAKKRAEVAPGVGTSTDMFVIGPTPGTLVRADRAFLEKLDEFYSTAVEKEHQAQLAATADFKKYIDDLINQHSGAQSQEAVPKDAAAEVAPPPDNKGDPPLV